MAQTPKRDDLTVLEAVDNLSSMAELDIDEVSSISSEDVQFLSSRRWFNANDQKKTKDSIDQTFRVIHKYLKHMGEKEVDHLTDRETQKGVEAIMSLAKEAARNLDSFNAIYIKNSPEHSISQSKEFRSLEEYYMNKLIKRFEHHLHGEDAWMETFDAEKIDLFDVSKMGLKDLETVKRDHEYELFYIRKEDGRPFFNRNLLRHIRLVLDFDEIVTSEFGEDPLIHVAVVQDYQAQFAAHEIKNAILSNLDAFITGFKQYSKEPLAILVNHAVTALMLASNKDNCLGHRRPKGAINYFHDFQLYLRLALQSQDYQQLIASPNSDNSNFSHTVIHLIHALCFHFFMHELDRVESLKFIKKIISSDKKQSKQSVWSLILDQHEQIYELLTHYPNGPLFKTLDVFRGQESHDAFDPLIQNNFPSILFDMHLDKQKITCIRMPSPTHQTVIDRAEPSEEFVGFLRYIGDLRKPKKLLLFNLQDRTNWRDFARADTIEKLSINAEFSPFFTVVTCPKSTDFYHQQGDYMQRGSAKEFIHELCDSLKSNSTTGHFFPKQLSSDRMHHFIDDLAAFLHKELFDSKAKLSRKNRLDFIELFYLCLQLKCIITLKPDIVSFVCKDWIDVGPTNTCGFHALVKLLAGEEGWSEKELLSMMETLLSPALLLRERVTDSARMNRFVSALSHLSYTLHRKKKGLIKGFEKLLEIKSSQIKIDSL